MAAAIRPGLKLCSCGAPKANNVVKVRQITRAIVGSIKQDKQVADDFLLQGASVGLLAKFTKQNNSTQSHPELLTFEETERLLASMTLKVRGADEAVLDSYTQFVTRAANVLQLDITGKITLPTHFEKRTLLKSPHIYKKHRAQYELRTHGRMVQIRQVTGSSADIFLEYIQRNLPEGVSMSVEEMELEELPLFIQKPDDFSDIVD